MRFKINAAKDEAISQISESDIIILNEYTGEYQTADFDYIFLLMDDTKISHCTVLIPETVLVYILKELASNGHRNNIYFDNAISSEKYSFGGVIYHYAHIERKVA
ncbi:hypothetical protein [Chitinophaga rhizosphaerae]|uniref:hypothetical protein n=1 Tax=Chitinophaga rhizosphaerae TaxID=1864947 RepID=UPI000F8130BA|nr:hypothetical protein [Chitinophaga rhizosphaerae]